ncbi:MAG: DUF6691 family protein [Trueperaceae bacterium]
MASTRTTTPANARFSLLTSYLPYLLSGTYFGFVLIKSEVVSWYRIQEMFRFQSFHMYGVLGSALIVAMVSVWLIKRYQVRTFSGEEITFGPKDPTYRRYVYGGTLFGLGWGLTGACPGPIFALIGSGLSVFLVILTSALLGTWAYGYLRLRLPH